MTRLSPAPDAVLHLVKCGCKKDPIAVPTTDASIARLDCSALISVAAPTTKRTTAATMFLTRRRTLTLKMTWKSMMTRLMRRLWTGKMHDQEQ